MRHLALFMGNKKIFKMEINTILLICLIGLIAGVVSGFIGIGGGIVIVPALVLILGMGQHLAQGTSLAMMLPPIGILAVMNYYKAGEVDIRIAVILSLAFIIGSYFSSKLALNLKPDVLKKVFAAVLILVGAKMLFFK